MNKVSESICVVMAIIFSVCIFFWKQILSSFEYFTGDAYDGNVEAILVSHWHWVINGERRWNEVNYFFPHPNTLGYNDGYLLYGLLAAPFRFLNMDLYGAAEISHIIIKIIGFLSIYKLFNYFGGKQKLLSIILATIYTISINGTTGGHAQLWLSSLTPLFLILLLKIIDSRGNYFNIALFFASYSILLISGFYTAFFITLFTLIFLLFLAILNLDKFNIANVNIKLNLKILLFLFITIIFSISPFLLTYLPKLKETGGHTYSGTLMYANKIYDLINIGEGSIVWGKVYQITNSKFNIFRLGENAVGFTPGFIILFFISCIYTIKSKNRSYLSRVAKSFVLATLLCLLIPIEFNGFSLWKYVYNYLPGAKGLRVTSRFYLILLAPMCLIIYINIKNKNKIGLYYLALVFVILEQLNSIPYVNLNTASEGKFIGKINNPPNDCNSFYSINPIGYESGNPNTDNLYKNNVRTMLISDHFNLPTITGLSSFNPPDWNFAENPKDTFIHRVREYATSHNLLDHLCEYDMQKNIWSKFKDKYPIQTLRIPFTINFRDNSPDWLKLNGFSYPESWGRWSIGKTASLVFDSYLPKSYLLQITGKAFSHNVEYPVNISSGGYSKDFIMTSTEDVYTFQVNALYPADKIEFTIPKPMRPSELGINNDSREIGIGISKIKISNQ